MFLFTLSDKKWVSADLVAFIHYHGAYQVEIFAFVLLYFIFALKLSPDK